MGNRVDCPRTGDAGLGPPEPLRGFIERVVVPLLLDRFLHEQTAHPEPAPDSPTRDADGVAA